MNIFKKTTYQSKSIIILFFCAASVFVILFFQKYPTKNTKNTPSISIEVSTDKKVYARGDSVSLTWSAQYAPEGSFVSLELIPIAPGGSLGIIGEKLSLDASIDWRIPPAIEQPRYGGDYRVQGNHIIDGNSYQVKATLYKPTKQICYEGCPPGFGTIITSSETVPFMITQ